MHTVTGIIATGFERERAELDAVLSSGIFLRAPNLAQLLSYICSRYFEGAAGHIKEYNIAVEALGRPPDFDQKKDSIVRVEAHKLRKRLREYYELDGSVHEIRIEIPPGQYAPRFVSQNGSPLVVEQPVADREDKKQNRRFGLPAIAVVTTVVVLGGSTYWGLSRARENTPGPVPDLRGPQQTGDDVRILAGVDDGSTYLDGFGRVWLADQFFQGGKISHAPSIPIHGTRDPRLYQNRREGSFSYHIPLKPGVYELRLHFAETLYGEGNAAGGGESSRLFRISINGSVMLRDFDVIGDAGSATADIKVFKDVSPAADGKLHLRLDPGNNQPILNAIEITPGIPGRMLPIRIIAQDHAYTSKDGKYWAPDRFARGGQLVQRNEDVINTSDPEFYRGERYGNLTYVIPVTGGRYAMSLYVSEMWFGPGQPGAGGIGSRLFDIMCNGVAVKRNFDIFKEAGGSRRVFKWTIHDLEPNHQGKLVISLVPVSNYACINAMEIVDEAL